MARRFDGSAPDRCTARHAGYAVSQRVRKRVEEIFGWMKTVGDVRRILAKKFYPEFSIEDLINLQN
jgi:hypothetical protein